MKVSGPLTGPARMLYVCRDTMACRLFPKEGVPAEIGALFLWSGLPVKKIECYIRQEDVHPLVDALAKTGVGGITVYPVEGFGKQRGKGTGSLLARTKVEVFTLDIETEHVLGTILKVTRKGRFGDGKVAILPVENVIRVRTGEKGAKAV